MFKLSIILLFERTFNVLNCNFVVLKIDFIRTTFCIRDTKYVVYLKKNF